MSTIKLDSTQPVAYPEQTAKLLALRAAVENLIRNTFTGIAHIEIVNGQATEMRLEREFHP